jgi:hypothetical protein
MPPLAVPDARGISIEICVERRCGRLRTTAGDAQEGLPRVPVALPGGRGDAPVRLVIRTARGRVLLLARGRGTIRTSRPSGVGCPPVCRQLDLRLIGRRVVSA